MKQILLPIGLTAIFILALGLFAKNLSQGKIKFKPPSDNQRVVVINQNEIKVEIADTDEARRTGLANHASLDENSGMLFIFDQKDIKPSFWMKGMSFSLDLIWINDENIVQIDKNVSPEPMTDDSELTLYRPEIPIDYVLEVNAGFSEKHGIDVGDRVELNI